MPGIDRSAGKAHDGRAAVAGGGSKGGDMRRRTSILIQGEGLHEQLRPGRRPIIIGAGDDADLQLTRGRLRQRHAALQWHDGRWLLYDAEGRTGIIQDGQRVSAVDLAQPATVRLGGPSGPVVALTPLPRPAVPRWRWWLLAAVALLLAATVVVLVVDFYLEPERTARHQPYAINTCVRTNPPWSAGQDDVRPPGQRVSCDGRFDYKVLRVIPVPTPQLTAFSTDKGRSRRALKLAEGRCPPASWPALGVPDASNSTREVYCVQDSIYTIDAAVVKEERDFMCVLRDGEEPRLATSCSSRHDFTVDEVVHLAETAAFPGEEEMARIGHDSCLQAPGTDPFVATEQTWRQGYRRQLLCLETDNFAYTGIIDWAVDDLRRYWDRELPSLSPKPSTVKVPSEEDYHPKSPPRCYGEPLEDNAIYCPEHDEVQWDPQWLRSNFYDTYGDIAVATVLAHEWGHVIQNRLGQDDPERLRRLSNKERIVLRVNQEHQADCYAGVWVWHYFHDDAAIGFEPDPTDRNKAVHAIVDVADPWTTSDEQFEEDAHGDALKRMQDLLLGYERGQEACQQLVTT
jgi:hypothetical protein